MTHDISSRPSLTECGRWRGSCSAIMKHMDGGIAWLMCCHFRSRDKYGGHVIWSTVVENPLLHTNSMAVCVTEPELLPIKVLHWENRDFPPLLLLWPWPWFDDLHIRTSARIPSRYSGCAKINFRQGFQKFSYYRQTDRQTQLNFITPLRR